MAASSEEPAPSTGGPADEGRLHAILLVSVFVAGISGLVYELLIGTISSYLLGDSVTQFSLTIGLTMSAMGIGTVLSRWIRTRLLEWFLAVEVALGVVGGLSVLGLLGAYRLDTSGGLEGIWWPAMVSAVVVIGALIGMEIPLLARILDGRVALRENLSNVLSLDYFGSLAATFLFPFVLLPFLGPYRSAPVAGLLNLGVVWLGVVGLRGMIPASTRNGLVTAAGLGSLVLASALLWSTPLTDALESGLYEDRVIHAEQSRYQRIVVTRDRKDVRLYLDGHLQFSSVDEHRYHEALVRVPAALAAKLDDVLVLGGGDGLVARELLALGAARIRVVDLDPGVTTLARSHPLLRAQNAGALDSPRVELLHEDAFQFLAGAEERFDLILADLPDPNSTALARLYSRQFFSLARARLRPGGVFATQATSPFYAAEAFWCIERTVRDAGFASVLPYHAHVPSMGDWGFVVAAGHPLSPDAIGPFAAGRFLSAQVLPTLFVFPADVAPQANDVSTLARPRVLAHYLDGWRAFK